MPRVVRVLPDVPAITKEFDYLVPEALGDQVRVGTVVRISLHGRRVRGWVVEDGVTPPAGVSLQPIAKVTGLGPTPELIDLARWAAWRWAGRPASLLRTGTPEPAVRGLPLSRPRPPSVPGPVDAATAQLVDDALAGGVATVRVPPAGDVLPIVLGSAALGNALVLCPSVDAARALGTRLRRAGIPVAFHPRDWATGAAGATVIGTRAAAWAPVRELAAIVVVDEHDEAQQQEQTPTWHARDVAIERAARAGVPCVLTSPCPTLEASAAGRLVVPSRSREQLGWPAVVVADRREEDPLRAGLFSPTLVRLLRGTGRVLCLLNRTGRAQLLACTQCGELAACEACGASVAQPDEPVLRCRRCGTERPVVCLHCGATRFKGIRAGVSRVREELEALLGEPVGEVTATTAPGDAARTRVVVGTEAMLHHIGRADGIVFLDLDQELLAPRYRAVEQAFALVARAARVVSAGQAGRAGRSGGRLLLQTRQPEHEVVRAAVHADPGLVAAAELERRRLLAYPPVSAQAVVSGPSAEAFMTAFGDRQGVDALGPVDGRWLLRAPDHRTLCDALAATERPGGRLRIEVDPLRI